MAFCRPILLISVVILSLGIPSIAKRLPRSGHHKHDFPSSVCFEQISNIGGLHLEEHPAGLGLVVASQDGNIKLISNPKMGSGNNATVLSSFLDLTGRVFNQWEAGLLGFAFHPQFLDNGRFFVSYICNGTAHPDCLAPCPCSEKKNCTTENTPEDCATFTVVSEFKVTGDPKTSTTLDPTEQKKWIHFGRPFGNHNGGDLWFGTDNLLYYSSGDGGSEGDPLRTAQNLALPYGKIFRVDINVPTTGSFGVPKDNPFVSNPNALPEIYALGLRNPWRCSVDFKSGATYCGDVGENKAEEVDLIVKGGNYGWSAREANHPFNNDTFDSQLEASFLPPLLSYDHPAIEHGQAVIGGYVYRSTRNRCLKGRYVYADEFGEMFVADVTPASYVAQAEVQYAVGSGLGTPLGETPLTYAWGIDNANELYRLTVGGIYRIVDASFCGFTC